MNQLQNMVNLYKQLQQFAVHHQELHTIASGNTLSPMQTMVNQNQRSFENNNNNNQELNQLLRQFLNSLPNANEMLTHSHQVAMDPFHSTVRSALYLPGSIPSSMALGNGVSFADSVPESFTTESSLLSNEWNEFDRND